MIAYYAIGGGLGHMTRARRVLDALQIDDAAIVASAKPDARVTGRYPVVDSLSSLRPERLIVDTFPLGLFGELADVDVPMDYVARLLKWDEYRRCVPAPLPRFGTMYVVEEITHKVESDRTVQLTLSMEDRHSCLSSPYWLIVHSGPEAEVRELIAYAEELQKIEHDRSEIVVVSQCGIGLDIVPASTLFAGAKRIISAAGFNVMLETEPYRDKHHVIPMPRRFDDQFARAARRRYDSSRICAAR
jgi:predicted glycosyltransferase